MKVTRRRQAYRSGMKRPVSPASDPAELDDVSDQPLRGGGDGAP